MGIKLLDAVTTDVTSSIKIVGNKEKEFSEVYVTLQYFGTWTGPAVLSALISNDDGTTYTAESTYTEDGVKGFWLSAGSRMSVSVAGVGDAHTITVIAAGHIKSL